jgi:hypothetical protein
MLHTVSSSGFFHFQRSLSKGYVLVGAILGCNISRCLKSVMSRTSVPLSRTSVPFVQNQNSLTPCHFIQGQSKSPDLIVNISPSSSSSVISSQTRSGLLIKSAVYFRPQFRQTVSLHSLWVGTTPLIRSVCWIQSWMIFIIELLM